MYDNLKVLTTQYDADIKDVVDEVIRFIEYYNNKRPKEYLGGLSPVAFRQQNPRGVYLMVIR